MKLKDIIKGHWDSFYEEGARRPVLGYEFIIDMGRSKLVSIRPPNYGPRKLVIMMNQIGVLKHNNWIREFPKGGWGAALVFAPKLHQ